MGTGRDSDSRLVDDSQGSRHLPGSGDVWTIWSDAFGGSLLVQWSSWYLLVVVGEQ